MLTSHRGFAVLVPHNRKGHVLVLAGRDAADVSDVVKQLQPSTPLPRDGAAVLID